MFRVSTTPIIRVHKTVSTASGTLQLPPWPCWREVAAQKIWRIPEAVVTVLCTPDDGCGWHSKHVEWICRIINRLLCVESRWTIINIYYVMSIKTNRVTMFKKIIAVLCEAHVKHMNTCRREDQLLWFRYYCSNHCASRYMTYLLSAIW